MPDAELMLTIPLSGVEPPADDNADRDHLPSSDGYGYDGYGDDEGWQDVDASTAGEEVRT